MSCFWLGSSSTTLRGRNRVCSGFSSSSRYRPASWQGMALYILALAFCVQVFTAIDRHSHSVSDTLYGIFPYFVTGAITAAGGAWNASIVAEAVSWGDTKFRHMASAPILPRTPPPATILRSSLASPLCRCSLPCSTGYSGGPSIAMRKIGCASIEKSQW